MTRFTLLLVAFIVLLGPPTRIPAADEPPKDQGPLLERSKQDDPLLKLFKLIPLEDVKGTGKEVYRLTIRRTFHSPLMITMCIVDGENSDLAVQKARLEETLKKPYDITKITRNSRFNISDAEARNFLTILEAAKFWELPTDDWRPNTGLDGSGWILEAIKDGKYHVVGRSNPLEIPKDEDTKLGPGRVYQEGLFTAACLYLWAFSNETEEPIY